MPVTFALTVHEPAAANVKPVKEIVLAPTGAVIVPVPHVVASPFGVATTRPAGSVSVKFTLASAWAAVTVKVTVVVPPTGIVAAPNAFEIVGGATPKTVNV